MCYQLSHSNGNNQPVSSLAFLQEPSWVMCTSCRYSSGSHSVFSILLNFFLLFFRFTSNYPFLLLVKRCINSRNERHSDLIPPLVLFSSVNLSSSTSLFFSSSRLNPVFLFRHYRAIFPYRSCSGTPSISAATQVVKRLPANVNMIFARLFLRVTFTMVAAISSDQ